MDLMQMQEKMMKRHYRPLFGFVKLRLGVRRTLDMITNLAMKWRKVARTGSIEAKTLRSCILMVQLKEFILSQREAYEVKIGDQLFKRPGDPSFDDVFAELHAKDDNDKNKNDGQTYEEL
ncbi:uncharacterized protein LOC143560219 [Bidens hawaiensis]|uniref:uncharacterized protein LOC143560219 n=1 Tax=Bidens hawaiensis TaxID=980011 RepID=UPI00404968BE